MINVEVRKVEREKTRSRYHPRVTATQKKSMYYLLTHVLIYFLYQRFRIFSPSPSIAIVIVMAQRLFYEEEEQISEFLLGGKILHVAGLRIQAPNEKSK